MRFIQRTETKILLFIQVLAMSILLPVAVSGCGAAHAASADPQTAVEALLSSEQNAWNSNDSATYASAFTENADFINIRGQIFTGQPAIAQVHAMIFAGPFKGSTIKITVRLFTLLAPRVALVDTDQEVTGFAFLPPGIVASSAGTLLTHFKYIASLQTDGSWKFTSGQNTAALPNPTKP